MPVTSGTGGRRRAPLQAGYMPDAGDGDLDAAAEAGDGADEGHSRPAAGAVVDAGRGGDDDSDDGGDGDGFRGAAAPPWQAQRGAEADADAGRLQAASPAAQRPAALRPGQPHRAAEPRDGEAAAARDDECARLRAELQEKAAAAAAAEGAVARLEGELRSAAEVRKTGAGPAAGVATAAVAAPLAGVSRCPSHFPMSSESLPLVASWLSTSVAPSARSGLRSRRIPRDVTVTAHPEGRDCHGASRGT
jgi:hypothetical protein